MLIILKKFNHFLTSDQKKKMIPLFISVVIGAFLEVFGVSMMVPFVSIIMSPDSLTGSVFINKITALGAKSQQSLILWMIGILIVIFVVKDLFLVLQSKLQADFVYRNRLKTQSRILHAYLCKPYEYFLKVQSGEVLRVIYTDVQQVYSLLMTLLSFASDSVVSLAIVITLLFISPLMTGIVIGLLALIVLLIVLVIRPVLEKEGNQFRKNRSEATQWILQVVHGIKEIKVADKGSFFETNFLEAGEKQNQSERKDMVLTMVPRMLIEMGCVVAVLVAVAVMVFKGEEVVRVVTVLGAFTMAASKLMPAANRIVHAMGRIAYQGPAMDHLIDCLEGEKQVECQMQMEHSKGANRTLTMEKSVEFSHICYTYPNQGETVFEDASMIIPAGKLVGIMGPSGAGKTTAVDILLGLLQPESGHIYTDGLDIQENYSEWLSNISYIPQSVFMMNNTIGMNVAFGNGYDEDRIWKVLEEAQLAEYVRKLPSGLDTMIGERGIRLSGGQRQRIGIARALYTDPALLVFDEATSSLDEETEEAIMESIHSLQGKKTMILIAHRRKTIENCEIVYRVQDGKIRGEEC